MPSTLSRTSEASFGSDGACANDAHARSANPAEIKKQRDCFRSTLNSSRIAPSSSNREAKV
jgi:hypothetical protein